MNKKGIITLIITLILIIFMVGIYAFLNKDKQINNNQGNITPSTTNKPEATSNKKILVVYYSATGSTARVAKEISSNLNADLFEIIPEEEYTSADLNYTDENSRVVKEHNNESLRDIKLKNITPDKWNEYDTILIGYPIWWGVAAWPVNNFIKSNDFTNKTVIPFCTSASSSLGNSDKLLHEMTNTGSWLDGHRFSSSASSSDIKTFTDSIK